MWTDSGRRCNGTGRVGKNLIKNAFESAVTSEGFDEIQEQIEVEEGYLEMTRETQKTVESEYRSLSRKIASIEEGIRFLQRKAAELESKGA